MEIAAVLFFRVLSLSLSIYIYMCVCVCMCVCVRVCYILGGLEWISDTSQMVGG